MALARIIKKINKNHFVINLTKGKNLDEIEFEGEKKKKKKRQVNSVLIFFNTYTVYRFFVYCLFLLAQINEEFGWLFFAYFDSVSEIKVTSDNYIPCCGKTKTCALRVTRGTAALLLM